MLGTKYIVYSKRFEYISAGTVFYSKIQLLISIYFAGDWSQLSSSSSDTSSSPNNGMEDEIMS